MPLEVKKPFMSMLSFSCSLREQAPENTLNNMDVIVPTSGGGISSQLNLSIFYKHSYITSCVFFVKGQKVLKSDLTTQKQIRPMRIYQPEKKKN